MWRRESSPARATLWEASLLAAVLALLMIFGGCSSKPPTSRLELYVGLARDIALFEAGQEVQGAPTEDLERRRKTFSRSHEVLADTDLAVLGYLSLIDAELEARR